MTLEGKRCLSNDRVSCLFCRFLENHTYNLTEELAKGVLRISQVKNKQLFGRTKITCSLDESELNKENIGLVLVEVLPVHIRNAQQIEFLRKVALGDQDIYNKQKKVRDDINNKFVENHIQHAIAFKIGYVFDGIQYVQMSNEIDGVEKDKSGTEPTLISEINKLNSYFRNNDKQSKDSDLQEEVYATGICPRIVIYGSDKETPFEIHNLDSQEAFVVYSSGIRGQPLFSVRLYKKKNYKDNTQTLFMEVVTKKKKFLYTLPYSEYEDYGRKKSLSVPQYVKPETPLESANVLGEIPIFEYTFNKNRQSLTEMALDSQDLLNQITSSEMDDVQQFVQSFIALINVGIDKESWEEVKEEGLFQFRSDSDGKKADIKIISNKLDYSGTKILYDRIYNIMLTNLGIPLLNTSGGGGDTGIARLTDNGWSMADTKARQDELGFKRSEKPLLKFVLNILKRKKLVTDLEISSVDVKFSRNKNDNLQTKVQALKMLLESGVHPQISFEIINLFGDPNEAFAKSLMFYGEQYYKSLGQSNKTVEEESTEEETVVKEEETLEDEQSKEQEE